MSKPPETIDISLLPGDMLERIFTSMVRIRRLEETIGELVAKNEIVCPCHLYIGQEAVAVGVCAALRDSDWVFSTHRSHGHYLAKGGDINKLMAELYGKATGSAGGHGGSMHLAQPELGLPGSSAIVGGTIPLAVGAALAFKLQKKDAVSVSFFGDGAVDEGAFYESLNFAALRKLPVIFVCENNLYSTHMPLSACLADTDIARKAGMFGMPGVRVDGNDVAAVFAAARDLVENARRGRGPALIEALTYRWRGHVGPSEDIDKGLRSLEELNGWKTHCPINALETALVATGATVGAKLAALREEVEDEIRQAIAFAKESPYPAIPESDTFGVFKE